jgi:hypothetical protein
MFSCIMVSGGPITPPSMEGQGKVLKHESLLSPTREASSQRTNNLT